jgi:glycosyltransferase involved in cell wall biosynthesis
MAVVGYQHRDWYPFGRVTELAPPADWPRRWLRFRLSLRAGRWLNRDQLKREGLRRLLVEHRPRLVHVHFLWNSYALTVASEAGLPVIFTAHGSDVMRAFADPDYRRELQEVFVGAACIIAVSEFIAARLAALGCPEGKIRVLPLGVPLPVLSPSAPRRDLHILSVGSLLPIKGHHGLLRAFAIAHRRQPALRLTIVGEGPERAALVRLISEEGLQDRVRLAGQLSSTEVAQLLARSDIYAQMGQRLPNPLAPDWPAEEGLGISYVEAAAHGLPLLATRAGGVPEICRHGQTGLLVEPEDVQGMAENILRLADDLQLRERLGQGGRTLVEEAFDLQRQTYRLESLYDELSGSGEGAA